MNQVLKSRNKSAMLRKDVLRSFDPSAGTADAAEVARFNSLAEEWWKPDGQFKVVHEFNAARVGVIIDRLAAAGGRNAALPLSGLRVADIGCGAGLVSEPLARAGAEVVGIDASEKNVAIAARHADASGLAVDYRCALPEDLAKEGTQFDAVISLEVVEHVADLEVFTHTIGGLVRPGGRLIVGTLNRTLLSWALAIVAAERVLGWLPRGTHEWSRFVRPHETQARLATLGFTQASIHGVAFNPVRWTWQQAKSAQVNYLQVFDRAG